MSKEQVTIATIVDINSSTKSLKELKADIDNAKKALEGLDTKSDEYKKGLEQLATAQSNYHKVVEEGIKKQANFKNGLDITVEATNGMIGGFQALQGIMALTGGENEKLVGTLVKLQAVSSVAQGFKQFTGSIKATTTAMKILNVTILANPIMALVAAVVAAVAILAYFANEAAESASGVAELNKQEELYNETLKANSDEQDFNIRMMKARGASNKELIQSNIEFTNKEIEAAEVRMDAIYEEIKALKEKIKWYKFGMGSEDKRLKKLEEMYENSQDGLNKMYDKQKKLNQDMTVATAEENIKIERAEKESLDRRTEERRKAAKDQIDIENKKQETLTGLIKDAETKEKELNQKRYEDTKVSLEDREALIIKKTQSNYNELAKAYAKMNDTTLDSDVRIENAKKYNECLDEEYKLEKQLFSIGEEKAKFEEELKEAQEQFDDLTKEEELELMREQLDTETEKLEFDRMVFAEKLEQIDIEMAKELEKAQNDAESNEVRAESLRKYMALVEQSTKIKQLDQKADNKIKAEQRKNDQLMLSGTKRVLSEASQLLGEHTAAGKATAIGATTIDTYQSATSAYKAMAGIPIVGPVLGAAAAGVAIASGMANVKSILKTKIPGGRESGGGAPTITPPTYMETLPPVQENFVKMDSEDLNEINKPNRVYVVESDISETQNRVRTTEDQATF